MDVKNAFRHGELMEDVYMQLPHRYVGYGKNISVGQSEKYKAQQHEKVCKLAKSLYGLKQHPDSGLPSYILLSRMMVLNNL